MTSKSSKPDTTSSKQLGRCPLCGEHDASEQCNQCQQYVCRDCYFALVGICKKCVSKSTAKKWKQRKVDWEKKLGVQWID